MHARILQYEGPVQVSLYNLGALGMVRRRRRRRCPSGDDALEEASAPWPTPASPAKACPRASGDCSSVSERASGESLALACMGKRDGARGSSKVACIGPGWDAGDSGSSMATATANEGLVRREMNAPAAMAIESCRSLHTQASSKQQAARLADRLGRLPAAEGGGVRVHNVGFRV